MKLMKRTLSIGALLCSGTAYAGAPGWTISESSGSVIVSRPGYSAAATRGGAIEAGDIIATGKNGRAVLVRGGEYLVVSPSARITIADPKPGGMTQIIQSFGNTLYKIKKMAAPHFAVETPYLAAVVKGTTFSVTVTPKGASVQVTEGRVEVATPDGGASFLVTPGGIGMVSADAPYRLRIEGTDARTIDSPNRPAGPAQSDVPAVPGDGDIEVKAVGSVSALDASITETVGEGSVQLASLSGGMISGDSAISMATTTARVAASVALPAPPAPLAPVPAEAVAPPAAAIDNSQPGAETAQAVAGPVVEAKPPIPSLANPSQTVGNGPTGAGTLVDSSLAGGAPGLIASPPPDVASAIPPVAISAGTSVPEPASGTGGIDLSVPPTVGTDPSVGNASGATGTAGGNGNGNNGDGLGNGGGNGSNAGGNGNGNNGDALGNGGGNGSNAGGNGVGVGVELGAGGGNASISIGAGLDDDDRDSSRGRTGPFDDDDRENPGRGNRQDDGDDD